MFDALFLFCVTSGRGARSLAAISFHSLTIREVATDLSMKAGNKCKIGADQGGSLLNNSLRPLTFPIAWTATQLSSVEARVINRNNNGAGSRERTMDHDYNQEASKMSKFRLS